MGGTGGGAYLVGGAGTAGSNGSSDGGGGGHLHSSQRGSQSALLSVKSERHKWPKGKDFLFSTWAFVIGKHNYYLSERIIVHTRTGIIIQT